MGKGAQYVQITIRLPPKVYQILEQYAGERTLTLQDALVIILLDYFGLIGGEDNE